MAAASNAPVLSRRVLNRTLLARQLLLERVDRPPEAVIGHLVGLQAQEPQDPYVALWSRIDGFDPEDLSAALEERRAVRLGLMRTTLHLATTDDALAIAPITAAVHRRTFRNTPFARSLAGVDEARALAMARTALETRPMTPAELGAELEVAFPGRDRTSLAALARYHLHLVQVPPRGLWRRTGRATNTTLAAWVGRDPGPGDAEELVRRYLAAFGPATVGDVRTWSGLTGVREIVDRLRPGLRTFRDEAGRELYDVQDGLQVDADVPAPVRFLPQYDNVFLSHQDRSRLNGALSWGLDFAWKGPILIDGFITAAWRLRREGRAATMTVELGRRLSRTERAALETEAGRLLEFLADDAEERDVRLEAPPSA
jgi:hypothetical protein